VALRASSRIGARSHPYLEASSQAAGAADPAGEFEELVGIYEAKGLNPQLARQVAEALTELDPVAAHADAELRLDALGPTSGAVLAALTAGLSYAPAPPFRSQR
jgi:VIT1/CCC1 family predicted Fe2+/Mn2+ transporter